MAEVRPLFAAAKKGFAVLLVFLFVAPPVQLLVALLMTHVWVGGQDVLIEISALVQSGFLPRLLPAYILYMPACLVAGLWAAHGVAKGGALTLSGVVGRMVLAGIVFEALFQATFIFAGGSLILSNVVMVVTQWVVSSVSCFFVWARLQSWLE